MPPWLGGKYKDKLGYVIVTELLKNVNETLVVKMEFRSLALIVGMVFYAWFGWCTLQLPSGTEYERISLFLAGLISLISFTVQGISCIVANLITECVSIVKGCPGLVYFAIPGPKVSIFL